MLCIQCGHSNPDGASHCASCATPLPEMSTCPSCQELVSADACFCAHCGATLQSTSASDQADAQMSPLPPPPTFSGTAESSVVPATEVMDISEVPSPPSSDVLDADVVAPAASAPAMSISQPPDLLADEAVESTLRGQAAEFTIFPETNSLAQPMSSDADEEGESLIKESPTPEVDAVSPSAAPPSAPPPSAPPSSAPPSGPFTDLPAGATLIQQPSACLVHIRSETTLTIPIHLELVHLGKPNDRVPPDIDLAGFPDSDVVSRVHADLRLEADGYYLQDAGSANGTYVNNQALRTGDRYRLRTGDRLSFGKEDKVSFIFKAG